ncbi:follistatin [Biomphalaria glabrata]|nr:follistatin [Biomphalaria glabrata]
MPLGHATVLAAVLLVICPADVVQGYFPQCEACDVSKCPELHYCEGEPIKDHCGCCTICSSSKFQPHVMIPQETEGKYFRTQHTF